MLVALLECQFCQFSHTGKSSVVFLTYQSVCLIDLVCRPQILRDHIVIIVVKGLSQRRRLHIAISSHMAKA